MLKKVGKLWFVLSISLLILTGSVCKADNVFFSLKSVNDQWLVYDDEYDAYVPYVNSRHGDHNTISLIINPFEYKGMYLRFYASNGLSVFLDNKIYKNYFKSDYDEISIDFLNRLSGNKKILVTFVGDRSVLPFKSASLASVKSVNIESEASSDDQDEISLIPRESQSYQSYYLLMILFVVGAFIFQKYASYNTFIYIYSPKSLVGRERLDDLNAHSDLDKFQVIYMVLNCICMSIVIITSYYQKGSFVDKSFIGEVLKLSAILLLGYAAKYVFLQICGFIFDVPKLVKIQYFEFLRLTLIFSLVMFIMTLLFLSPFAELSGIDREVFDYFAFILLMLLVVKIGLMLKKASAFQNMYLISYLCITEILPVMFFYRIYFQVGYFLNL